MRNQRVRVIISTEFGKVLRFALGRAIRCETQRDKGGPAAKRVLKMAEQPLEGSIQVLGLAKE